MKISANDYYRRKAREERLDKKTSIQCTQYLTARLLKPKIKKLGRNQEIRIHQLIDFYLEKLNNFNSYNIEVDRTTYALLNAISLEGVDEGEKVRFLVDFYLKNKPM